MIRGTKLILLDPNSRRRAAISHCLSGGGIHVEPFESISELRCHWPTADVVLVHDGDGAIAGVIAAMNAAGNWLPMVAFSEQPEIERVVEAVLDGVVDYVAWPSSQAEISVAIERAAPRSRVHCSARYRETVAQSRIAKLTPREREVLAGVAFGLPNRLIGERLAISPRTVEIHRANMLSKLGANHSSEAIRIAIEASLIDERMAEAA